MSSTSTETLTTGTSTISIDATAADVWAVLSDLGRIGDISPECFKAEWEPGVTEPARGAPFRGYNRMGDFEWDTACMVVAAAPELEWSIAVTAPEGPATIWRYLLSPTDKGCEVTETFDSPALLTEYFQRMSPPRDGQLRENISQTLTNLKVVVEG